ncbi:MAG: FeoA family protein [Kiritimatiellia bacterium]
MFKPAIEEALEMLYLCTTEQAPGVTDAETQAALLEAETIREVGTLCDGRPGSEGVVAYLSTRDNREVQKMMAMGILPGTPIQVIQSFPSHVFQIGFSQFAVDKLLAESIHVHWKTVASAATQTNPKAGRHLANKSRPTH